MSAAPCKRRPFRVDSALGYDSDALDALRDGNEPSCHEIAGLDAVFHEVAPCDRQRCRGYDAWCRDEPGYREPVLAPAAA